MYFFLFSINVQQCGYKNCKTQFLILPPSLLFLLFKLLLLCQPIFNDLSSGMLGLMETSSLAKVRFCLSSTFLEVELVTLLALFLKGFLKIDFLFFLGVFNWIFSLSRFEWMALSLPISVWNICREFWASLKSDFSWLLVFLVDSWSSVRVSPKTPFMKARSQEQLFLANFRLSSSRIVSKVKEIHTNQK